MSRAPASESAGTPFCGRATDFFSHAHFRSSTKPSELYGKKGKNRGGILSRLHINTSVIIHVILKDAMELEEYVELRIKAGK